MATTQVEITIIVDADGNVVASHDADIANEACESECFDQNRRVIRITLTVPTPEDLEVTGEITGDQATLVLSHA